MTQEEIREGIDKEVAWELCLYCRKHDQDPNPNNQCHREEPCEATMVTAKTIREIYHSQGVVIKVGEISEDLAETASEGKRYVAIGNATVLISSDRTSNVFESFKDAGLVAVKSLIETGG